MMAILNEREGVAYRAFFRLNRVSGIFAVEYPDLPGCVGGGSDFVQARADAKRALDAWIDASLQSGAIVPAPASGKPPPAAAHTVWIAARSGVEQRRVQSPKSTS